MRFVPEKDHDVGERGGDYFATRTHRYVKAKSVLSSLNESHPRLSNLIVKFLLARKNIMAFKIVNSEFLSFLFFFYENLFCEIKITRWKVI